MDLWYPPKDRPQLLEWWRPLILASKAARSMGSPWPINVDELILRGRVDRASRPAIWVYTCPASGGELYLDSTGQPYRFIKTPKARSLGRFTECELSQAIWAAGLPQLREEEQARSSHPAARRNGGRDRVESGGATGHEPACAPTAPPGAAPEDEPPGHEPRRRGHLLVYEGGRQLAG